MNEKQFNEMSLYTLASLFIDTYNNYGSNQVSYHDKKLHDQILNYVIDYRHDEKLFFEILENVGRHRRLK